MQTAPLLRGRWVAIHAANHRVAATLTTSKLRAKGSLDDAALGAMLDGMLGIGLAHLACRVVAHERSSRVSIAAMTRSRVVCSVPKSATSLHSGQLSMSNSMILARRHSGSWLLMRCLSRETPFPYSRTRLSRDVTQQIPPVVALHMALGRPPTQLPLAHAVMRGCGLGVHPYGTVLA